MFMIMLGSESQEEDIDCDQELESQSSSKQQTANIGGRPTSLNTRHSSGTPSVCSVS